MVANAPADGRLLAEYGRPQSPILRAELSVAAKRPDEMNSVASLDPQAPPHVETANAPAAPGRRCRASYDWPRLANCVVICLLADGPRAPSLDSPDAARAKKVGG